MLDLGGTKSVRLVRQRAYQKAREKIAHQTQRANASLATEYGAVSLSAAEFAEQQLEHKASAAPLQLHGDTKKGREELLECQGATLDS